jgi:hypothetical protein
MSQEKIQQDMRKQVSYIQELAFMGRKPTEILNALISRLEKPINAFHLFSHLAQAFKLKPWDYYEIESWLGLNDTNRLSDEDLNLKLQPSIENWVLNNKKS